VLGAGDVVTIEKLVNGAFPPPFHTSHTPAKAKGIWFGTWRNNRN
jgi:hypothetical protein